MKVQSVPFRAAGVNGVLTLHADKLIISRPGGCMATHRKSEKTVFYSKLSAVEFKVASRTSGYIQLIFSGSRDAKGSLFDLTRDENTVMFAAKDQPFFEAVREFVEDKISTPASSAGGLSELEQLAGLRDKGIITEEEFQAKKKKILGL